MPNPMTPKPMPQDLSTSNNAASMPEAPIELPVPTSDEQLSVQILPGAHLSLPFDLTATTLVPQGDDLILQLEGGGSMTLVDFARHSKGLHPPMVELQDGSLLPGQALLSALSAESIETASGEESPAGSGIGEYHDDPGDLIQGVTRMDGLDFEPVSEFRFPDSDDLGYRTTSVLSQEDQTQNGPLGPLPGDTADSEDGQPSGGDTQPDTAGGVDASDNGGTTGNTDPTSDTGDTTPPQLQVDPIGLTSDDTPTLSGTAEPGSTITVITDAGEHTTATAGDGTWSLPLPEDAALTDGEHSLEVIASDTAGNTTSGSVTVIVDTTAPQVTVEDLPLTSDNTPTLSGTAEPDSTLIIEVGGQTLTTTSDANGDWSASIPDETPLGDGAFTVVVTATDAAGNMASADGSLNVDTQAPEIIAAEMSPEGDLVSGSTEADATVTLTLPDGQIITVAADSEGNFDIPLDTPFTAGETLQLVANDDAGNPSASFPVISPSAPNAGDIHLTTAEDTAIEISAADLLAQSNDSDSADLTINDVTLADPSTGSLVDNGDGTWTYTPAPDFNSDNVVLNFTVSDGALNDTGVASVAVTPVNDIPVVATEIPTQLATEDSPFEFAIPEGTFNDVDNTDLSLSVGELPDGLTFDPATGLITGTPTVPGTYTVTVTADDGQDGTVSETFTIEVANVNDAPRAGDDEALHTPEDIPLEGINVLANDTDPDGDTLTVSHAEADNGSVTINADGTLDYTPDADFNGSDTITYTISDGNGGQDAATVSLTVDPVADANADAVSALPHQTAMIDVLANDTAAEMNLTSVELADPTQGSVAIVDNQVQFTPADGVENTTVELTYTFTDGQGNVDGAQVDVTLGDYASAYDLAATGDLASSIDMTAVSVDGGSHAIEAELYPNSNLSFTISAEIPEVAPKLDLYMVQDMTGSFWGDDLPTVRGEVSDTGNAADLGLLDDIVSGVTAKFSDAQFGIGSFNDTPNSGDHQQFLHELDLGAGNGGLRLDDAYDAELGNGYYGADYPESQAYALQQVALMAQNGENGFREDAAKVAVMITDAPSHGSDAELAAMADALDQADVRVIFLVAGDNTDFYQAWIDDYGVDGTVVPLASDSSNIVEALTTGIDNLQESLSLDITGDAFGLATIGEGTINADGTITWEVQLEAPLDGSHAESQLEFVVNDSNNTQVGEAVQLNVHTQYQLDGTAANDYLQGHSGDNHMLGNEGDDLLEGLGGNDNLDGGSGNDILVGGEGADILTGAQGNDHLSGGAGADSYAFSANGGEGDDVIQDFDVASDAIRLSDVLDAAPDGSTDLEALLSAGDQHVQVAVSGANVELQISGDQGQTSITLEGINAGGAFDGHTSLTELIDSGLMIQHNPM